MKQRLERRYNRHDLHFITFSCYRRMPMLANPRRRDLFLNVLNEVRNKYDFTLVGYVVMPEHVHLLISEPSVGNPSLVIQVLKQRISRALRRRRGRRTDVRQARLWEETAQENPPRLWQRRFYDFNVWSTRKRNEKLNYIHFNPVRRKLAAHPGDWPWSSYRFYWNREAGLCPPNPGWTPKQKAKSAPKLDGTLAHALPNPQSAAAPSRFYF